jgi:hypothetical protein
MQTLLEGGCGLDVFQLQTHKDPQAIHPRC